MNNNTILDGVINVYKEREMTSHDVVFQLRKILKTKKIGHAGTLDPNVTGVLAICIGNSTKLSSYLMNNSKTYIGELYFGIETDTEDIWGNIIKTDCKIPSEEELTRVIDEFNQKSILQTPPMYSAIKVNGKKLYEIARKGEVIDRKSRKVFIYDISLLRFYENKAQIKVTCSKGTYIRTLFKNIAEKCGSCGTMSSLVRISSGGLKIDSALTLNKIKFLAESEIFDFIIPPEDALVDIEKIIVPDYLFKKVINGVAIKTDLINLNLEEKKEYLVYCKGEFIGVYKHENKILKVKTYLFRGNK
ncbi:tRNA pseudouridine(55) synthase TruB [Lagierella sp.]|uniref:tRNA pseudouridine(55) synthase TruB n=1 Tax=Lagierella sp. TaxID=2849657 RepID=UPI002602147D|nr:tRNA pseudouridine(55) synthase TruB [Lagierella sp.]